MRLVSGLESDMDAPCFQGGDLFGAGLVAEGIAPQVQPLQVGQGRQRAHIGNTVFPQRQRLQGRRAFEARQTMDTTREDPKGGQGIDVEG